MTASGTSLPSPLEAFAGRTFDAVLFDMDGTLVDSTASVDRAWRRWAGEFGLPDADKFRVRHGVPAALVVPSLVPADQVGVAIARIMELELTDTAGIEVLPGAADMLAGLPAQRAAIVTSCTRALARARIEASGLEPPATVVTADDVERGKPNPEPYHLGAARLGFEPSRCLVVEDAPAGIRSGKAAGAVVLAVGGTHDLTELAEADAGVSGLDQVRFAVGPNGLHLTAA